MEYIARVIRFLMEGYSAPVFGLTYIVVKLFIKHIIHKAIDHEFDLWDVFAWFGVDITLLSLSISAASKIHAKPKLNLTGEAAYFFYFIFTVFVLFNAVLYLFFTKRRDSLNKLRPYKDWKLGILLSFSWLIGFAWFWGVLDALK